MIEREGFTNSPILSTLPHSNPEAAIFVPECPWTSPEREGLFKHPVRIENKATENLFFIPGIMFCHHAGRTEKIETFYVFSGIQNPDTLPSILEEPADRSFSCSCKFSNDCICHVDQLLFLCVVLYHFSLSEKYFVPECESKKT
jgi:hypothetical protein